MKQQGMAPSSTGTPAPDLCNVCCGELYVNGDCPQCATIVRENARIEKLKAYPLDSFRGIPRSLQETALKFDVPVNTPSEPASLFLTGETGAGKTCGAVAIVAAWVRVNQRAIDGEFMLAWDFLARIKASFRRDAQETEMDIVERTSRVPCLIIDDLGAENNSVYNLSTLTALLAKREHNGLVTIVTSNLSLKELHEIEPRIASRLRAFNGIKLSGDHRAKASPS